MDENTKFEFGQVDPRAHPGSVSKSKKAERLQRFLKNIQENSCILFHVETNGGGFASADPFVSYIKS